MTKSLPPKKLPVRKVPEPLLDSEEAAAIIGIHPKTPQRYARQRLIRGIHVGKLWRFRASTIQETLHHANFKVTMDIYTQGTMAIRRNAHTKVARQLMGEEEEGDEK